MTLEQFIDKLVGCRKFKDGKYLSQEVFTREELVNNFERINLDLVDYTELYELIVESQKKAIAEGREC